MRRAILVIWSIYVAGICMAQTAPTINPVSAPYNVVSGTAQAPAAPYTDARIAVCMAPAKPDTPPDCTAGGAAAGYVPLSRHDNPAAGYQYVRVNADGTYAAELTTPLASGNYVWVVEYVDQQPAGADKVITKLTSPAVQVNPTPDTKFYDLTPVRLIGGIEVAAAASADPSAKFLLDASLEHPLSSDPDKEHRSSYLNAPLWTSGYIRLASIAQPGPLTGVSNLATYVSPLLTSTTDKIVQSAEAEIAFEATLIPRHIDAIHGLPNHADPYPTPTIHFIAEGGVITPLSPSQANPTVYVVTPALYTYYQMNANATGLLGVASAAVASACKGATVAGTASGGNCYIAYLPQDRTRFYRQWDTGFRLRWYYHSSDADQHFLFPSSVTATFGQNEYVTRGQLRNYVLHLAASSTLPPSIGGNLAGLLYAYGAVDLNVNGQNQNGQEFLLNAADATITPSSANVATVTVASPFRDRYRFGIALDLAKLVSLVKNSSPSK